MSFFGLRLRNLHPLFPGVVAVFSDRLISFFLIVMVMVCPLRCGFGECFDGNDAQSERGDCGCCLAPQTMPDSPNPLPISPVHCQCSDCFCVGALMVIEVSEFTKWGPLGPAPISLETVSTMERPLPVAQVIRQSSVIPVDSTATAARAALACWVL